MTVVIQYLYFIIFYTLISFVFKTKVIGVNYEEKIIISALTFIIQTQ